MDIRKHYDSFVNKFLAGDSPVDDNVADQHSKADMLNTPPEGHVAPQTGVSPPGQAAAVKNIGSTPVDPVSGPNAPPALAEDSVGSETDPADSGPKVSGGGDPELRGLVIAAIKEVYDPEIPLNIYDLGLIYRVEIDSDNGVMIDMTLTSPHCPVAESLPGEVESAARAVEGITDVQLELVWDPPWDMDRMGEAGRLELGLL
jgi:FeS assembly SUF system protein